MSAEIVTSPRRPATATPSPFSRRLLRRLAAGQPMGIGAYMYVAHRITGLLLILYLFAHLVVLGSVLSGPGGLDRMMDTFASPLARLLELGLVWVVLFHAFNGIRLIALHLAPGINQKRMAYAVIVLSFGIALVSLPLFLEM